MRIREVDTVDPVIAEQLGLAHPLARHLDDFSPTWPTLAPPRTPGAPTAVT
ncbi:hypothetical protein [Nonomuraea lactucae]|uniref:hypothetical protein n=1 Tax=Nonomuraea lactucae TaxID=2249762 RepID=UPI001F0685D3|nr:hypothetical protein [Nonomuraea lactucae]